MAQSAGVVEGLGLGVVDVVILSLLSMFTANKDSNDRYVGREDMIS